MMLQFTSEMEKRCIKNGILTRDMFQRLCREQDGQLGEEDLKSYLLELDLAVEMKNEELFIPALVSDANKVHF